MRYWKLLACALAALIPWACAPGETPAPAPDMILVDGKVLTVDLGDSVAEAVAVRGDRIVAVGTSADIRALAGDQTRVVELGGRTLIPGLNDSHIHAIRTGRTYGVELSWADATTLAEGLERLREAARRLPPGTWINVVGGWHKSQFEEDRLPTPEEIAQISGDHPVYVQYLYRQAILNQAAMAALGISEDADVSPRGRLERDADGAPTGRIFGIVPTFAGLYGRLPKPDRAGQIAGTKAFFTELNRLGMTAIGDPAGGGMPPEAYEPLYEIWRRGELTLRIAFSALPLRPGNELNEIKAWAASLPDGLGDGWLKFNGFGEVIIWGMHDGDRTGLEFSPSPEAQDALREALEWLAANRHRVEIHASSDSSARLLLDMFEDLNSRTPIRDLRWAIAHIDDASEDTLKRMMALGMAYTVQDRLLFAGDEVREAIGAERALNAPPIRTALDLGIRIAAGTDAPRVSPYNPWHSIRWLLDGKSISGAQIRGPAQAPSRAEALRLYTANGAWMSFDETERGSIEPGKLADLAVLSADYMTVPVERIGDIEALITILGGRIIHAAGPYAELVE